MPDTAPQIIWHAAGRPAPGGKTGSTYAFEPCEGVCATCAAPITEGVPFEPRRGVSGVNNATFYGHAEYARYGTHVCAACAWMYGEPKRHHRGVLAIGNRIAWPLLGTKPDGDRPRWRQMWGDVARMAKVAPDTPMTGVLTTDVKPRLWPRCKPATAARPGVYLHSPDHDWSAWVDLDLGRVAACMSILDYAVSIGASKRACWSGIGLNTKLIDKHPEAVERIDAALAPHKGSAELLVAVLTA